MIEIRELVIRATVVDSPRNNGETTAGDGNSESTKKKGSCSETIDMMLQIINDKKER
jgi:hypothetical protein